MEGGWNGVWGKVCLSYLERGGRVYMGSVWLLPWISQRRWCREPRIGPGIGGGWAERRPQEVPEEVPKRGPGKRAGSRPGRRLGKEGLGAFSGQIQT